MSNGKHKYSLEEQSTLLSQLTKTGTLINEGKRPFDIVSRALQAIIADDSIVSITPKVISDKGVGKIFHVVGSFNDTAGVIDAGKYDYHYGYTCNAMEIAKVPMIIQPVDRKVTISPPIGKALYTRELFDLYPKMADPMTLLTLGAKFPKEHFEEPIIVVWEDHTGESWYAELADCEGRSIDIQKSSHKGDIWRGYSVLLCDDGTGLNENNIADKEISRSFLVTFDPASAFSDMVNAGKYGYVNPDITKENFPLNAEGKTEDEVFLLHFNHPVTSEQAIAEMERQGLRPATSTHALAFGAQHPAEQEKHPIVFLGSSWDDPCDGVSRVLYLGVGDGVRKLFLFWFDFDWRVDEWFAAVRK